MICKSCSWKLAPSFICTVLFQGAPDADLIFGSGKRAPPKWRDSCCLCLSRIYHHHQFVEAFVRHQWYRLRTDQCCRDISFSGVPLLRNWDSLGITFCWVGQSFVMGVDETICLVCGGSTFVGETISCETCLHWWVNSWYFTITTNFKLTFQGITLTVLVLLTMMIASSKRTSPTFVQGFLLIKLIVNCHIWLFSKWKLIHPAATSKNEEQRKRKNNSNSCIINNSSSWFKTVRSPLERPQILGNLPDIRLHLHTIKWVFPSVDHLSLPLPGFCWKQVKAEQEKSWERSSSKKYPCGVKGRCFAFPGRECKNTSNVNNWLF